MKVYNGMRAKGTDAGFLVGRLVQRGIRAKQAELMGRAACNYLADLLDGNEFGWFTGVVPRWYWCVKTCRERMQMVYATGQRDPGFDVGFEAFFNLSGEWTFAYFHCEEEELMDVWKELSGFEDYPAWDNTDRPDDVSAEDWAVRCREWSDALDGVALSLSFTDAPCPSFSPEYEPSLNSRALRAAEHLYLTECGDLPVSEDGGSYQTILELNRRKKAFRELPDLDARIAAALLRLPSISGFVEDGNRVKA